MSQVNELDVGNVKGNKPLMVENIDDVVNVTKSENRIVFSPTPINEYEPKSDLTDKVEKE